VAAPSPTRLRIELLDRFRVFADEREVPAE